MNTRTFKKIEQQAETLKNLYRVSLCPVEEIFCFELFDEPYKMALRVLECDSADDFDTAWALGLNEETVKQVRRALGVN